MVTRKVLVADASQSFCEALSDALGGAFQLICCHDGIEALTLLDRFHPDVFVVDLTLPGLDGLTVLRTAVEGTPRPACLVTTRFSSPYIEAAITSIGIDYVVMKPCDIRALADRILDLMGCSAGADPLCPQMDRTAAELLAALGIRVDRQGFRCLEAAVWLYLEKPGISMTKELYPRIAREGRTSASAVERSIRRAIEGAWQDRDDKLWQLYFLPDRSGYVPKPTNSLFIANVAERLRSCCQNERL